jgi:glycine betaine/proline transport system permease protein
MLDPTFSGPLDHFNSWVRSNRLTHPLFTGFFSPISDAFETFLGWVESFLLWLPFFVLPVTVFLIIARTGRYLTAFVSAFVLLYPGIVGMWEVSMETLALMIVSVLVSLAIGIPLGIWAAFNPRVERALRPLLDAMQTVPATVYLIPVVLFFSIGRVPGAIATVIYAIPPAIRLTTLGIKQVPHESVEASTVFGSTKRQTLLKVQLPMATPSIMAGVNQTIMMALGIVVLATFVGAGGLGQEVLGAIQRRRVSDSLVAGFTIVALAVVLDRVTRTVAHKSDGTRRWPWWLAPALLAGLVILGRAAGWVSFPHVLDVDFARPMDAWVSSFRDFAYPVTSAINDFLVGKVLLPAESLLGVKIAWAALIVIVAWMGWRLRSPWLALFNVLSLLFIGAIGMWALGVETLVQTLVAVLLSAAVAVPIGIWAGRHPKVDAAITPMLDTLQTIPAFCFILPVVMLFTVSAVPGIIASVLYAAPVGIRLTSLGIRQVPPQAVEASEAFGATPRQTMWGVRVPLAGPSIMAAMNQVIMMVLSMVIIAGMVGAGGLGFEAVRALTRNQVGLGFEVGVAIVVMAMILDRLTEAGAKKMEPAAAT